MRTKPSRPFPVGGLAIAAFALGLLLFYWNVVWGKSVFVFVDASRFFYPLWKWGAEVLRQGIIPLWNYDAQFGTPYLADPQMACAYPPLGILYLFLNPTSAFSWLILLHHFWALAGAWTWLRFKGLGTGESFLGSLLFGFSLHLVCSSWTAPALLAISWTPWVFLAAEKVYLGSRGGFLWFSLALAMQLSTGYPALSYLTGLALGVILISRSLSENKKPIRPLHFSWVGPFLGSALVATLYNLVWGLPFLGLLARSNYGEGASHFQALGGMDLATWLSPFPQGHPLSANYHGPHYWDSTYFMGLTSLCLILWGAFSKIYRAWTWLIFGLFLLLSLGETAGLAKILKAFLPGYSLVVHSGFWISLVVLWSALMAAQSCGTFLTRKKITWIPWALVFAGIYGISLLVQKPLFLWAFLLSLGFGIAAVFFSKPALRWTCLALSLGLSLLPEASSVNITLDRSYYEKPPAILANLPKFGRLFYTEPTLLQSTVLKGANMEGAYQEAKEKFYPNWPLAFEREEVNFYNTLKIQSTFEWTYDAFRFSPKVSRKLLDYLGARYVFGKTTFKDFKKVGDAGGVPVFENPTPCPKWFSVARVRPGSSETSLVQDLKDWDPREVCQLSGSEPLASYSKREVQMVYEGGYQFYLRAPGQGKALLVSSMTYDSGWKAWVRGKPTTLLRVNGDFLGLELEEGQTEAAFSYEPTSFRLGLFFCLGIWALWSGLFLKRILP